MTPISARNAMRVAPTAIRMRRLFKNLNIAPCANRFKPDVDLVIHLFLNHIVTNGIRYLSQGWDRIKTAILRLRHKDVVVVLLKVFIRRPDELPEPQIEVFLHPDPVADCRTNGGSRGSCLRCRGL